MAIKENLRVIMDEVRETALRNNRRPEEIILVGVSKTFEAKLLREAYEAGLSRFGESRVQEAEEKIADLKDLGIEWHLVGHLQSNKAKKAVGLFSLIQSMDKLSTAEKVDQLAKGLGMVQDILVEVNTSKEATKSGIRPEETKNFIENCLKLSNIRVKGLMTIAPFIQDEARVRDSFLLLRDLFERMKGELGQADVIQADVVQVDMRYLSMGMSDDFRIAIECGSNMLRIGRRIFGER